LNILQEYGLIISHYNSHVGYEMCVAAKNKSIALGFSYQNSDWGLVPIEDRAEGATLRIHGVALSQAGRELLKIVEVEPIDNYSNDLRSYFEKQKLRMTPISGPNKT